jgi:hypothetical protein
MPNDRSAPPPAQYRKQAEGMRAKAEEKRQGAEPGVETACQLAFLRTQQCPEAEGDLFSPPVGADRLRELLTTGVGR